VAAGATLAFAKVFVMPASLCLQMPIRIHPLVEDAHDFDVAIAGHAKVEHMLADALFAIPTANMSGILPVQPTIRQRLAGFMNAACITLGLGEIPLPGGVIPNVGKVFDRLGGKPVARHAMSWRTAENKAPAQSGKAGWQGGMEGAA
jgi:hypothetical protein